MNEMKTAIILIFFLFGIGGINNAQTITKIKKTTWYVDGVKKSGGGDFWGISFDTPYVYFYVIKNNKEKGTITYKMDSYAGGIWIGHDTLDKETKITINTIIPNSAKIPTYTLTVKKGKTTARATLEIDR